MGSTTPGGLNANGDITARDRRRRQLYDSARLGLTRDGPGRDEEERNAAKRHDGRELVGVGRTRRGLHTMMELSYGRVWLWSGGSKTAPPDGGRRLVLTI